VGSPLPRLRKLAMALDGVSEKVSHGAPAWFVRGRMFASFADDHHGDGRIAAWCKAPPGAQHDLVDADPDRYFVPPYVGPSGWVGVRLEADRVDWGAVAEILRHAHAAAGAKRR
jgi:hypothetical protein